MNSAILKTVYFILFLCINIGHEVLSQHRIRLGNHINTKYDETKPVISYDNTTLYLARQNHPDNVGGKNDDQDIYVSKMNSNGEWSNPLALPAPLNNKHPNGISSLSKDGNEALIINIFEGDTYKTGASIAFKENDAWLEPEPVKIYKFKNASDYVDYFESADGRHMFLAIDSRNSFGDQDIYISERIDDYTWSEPYNLGDVINTPDAEFSPFLSSDNKVLFFASYGHQGYGDSDIYYSRRLDDSWLKWSKPVNLGKTVNTEGFEAYYTIPSTGDYAYFVSNHETENGSKDIFRSLIPDEVHPSPGSAIHGEVVVSNGGSAIENNILIQEISVAKPDRMIKSSKEGFKVRLENNYQYRFLSEKRGYMTCAKYISLLDKKVSNKKLTLELVPATIGNSITSFDVNFLPNTSILNQHGIDELKRFQTYLKHNKEIQFSIACHISKTSSPEGDLLLSEERANMVVKFFVNHGIDANRFRIVPKGSGESYKGELAGLRFPDQAENRMVFTVTGDTDGDGIPNQTDRCPEVSGTSENFGCPEVKQEVVAVFERALSGIQFESGKDILKVSSYEVLNEVVSIMKENESFNLKISGHTDSQGRSDINLSLSEKRAKSTKSYLVSKGVAPERMKSYGFGEDLPIADNQTSSGRAKNRRVEFEVIYDRLEL